MLARILRRLVAAGVVDFEISHNDASPEVDLSLRDGLKI
jgi:hypothetical protein